MHDFVWTQPILATVYHVLSRMTADQADVDSLAQRFPWARPLRSITDLATAERFRQDWSTTWSRLALSVDEAAVDELTDESVITQLRSVGGMVTSDGLPKSQVDEIATAVRTTAQQLNASGLDDELQLRSQPLKQAWAARGPGYINWLRKQPGVTLRDVRPTIVMLLPLQAGWGSINRDHCTMAVEAMLTNIDDRLPEVARLAWLLTRLLLTSEDAERATELTLATLTQLDWIVDDAATRELVEKLWQPSC